MITRLKEAAMIGAAAEMAALTDAIARTAKQMCRLDPKTRTDAFCSAFRRMRLVVEVVPDRGAEGERGGGGFVVASEIGCACTCVLSCAVWWCCCSAAAICACLYIYLCLSMHGCACA